MYIVQKKKGPIMTHTSRVNCIAFHTLIHRDDYNLPANWSRFALLATLQPNKEP